MNIQALIAKAVGAFLVIAIVWFSGYSYRDHKADLEALTQHNAHLTQLEEERTALQGELNEITTRWNQETTERNSGTADIIADLRDRNIRLRVQLADTVVASVTGDGEPSADGRAELHPDAAAFLIGEAQRADSQVNALQNTVRALQGGPDAPEKD